MLHPFQNKLAGKMFNISGAKKALSLFLTSREPEFYGLWNLQVPLKI
jgi:hypothetical protein